MHGALAWGLLAAGAAGCNAPTTGTSEVLTFTPSRCGYHLRGCDFSGPIAVGGALAVQVRTVDGADGAPSGVSDLTTRDPTIATVARSEAIDGTPSWELTAHAAGSTRLFAVDTGRIEIDSIDIRVAAPARLGLQPVLGTIDGPTLEQGGVEVWTVVADKPTSFDVIAKDAGDTRLMGRQRFSYQPFQDAAAPRELEGSDRGNGYFYIQAAAADYNMIFALERDHAVNVTTRIRALGPVP